MDNKKNVSKYVAQPDVLARRSGIIIALAIIAIIADIGITITIAFIDNMWIFAILIFAFMTASIVAIFIFHARTPKIIAEIDGDELIFYRYKQSPLRVKAKDIIRATSYGKLSVFFGSVVVELENSEENLYYHTVQCAFEVAKEIEEWKHKQLSKQLAEAEKSST